jgi:hypothetical protein
MSIPRELLGGAFFSCWSRTALTLSIRLAINPQLAIQHTVNQPDHTGQTDGQLALHHFRLPAPATNGAALLLTCGPLAIVSTSRKQQPPPANVHNHRHTTMKLLSFLVLAAAAAASLDIEVTQAVECERKTQKGDAIQVHYDGRLQSNGKQFDSSMPSGRGRAHG